MGQQSEALRKQAAEIEAAWSAWQSANLAALGALYPDHAAKVAEADRLYGVWAALSDAVIVEGDTDESSARPEPTTEQRIAAALRLADSVCAKARRAVDAAKTERDRQTEIAELGEEVVTALHDESDGIGAAAGMPHRLRSRFLCVQQRGIEAEAVRDRDALAADGAVA
jgi:hypothetical protein